MDPQTPETAYILSNYSLNSHTWLSAPRSEILEMAANKDIDLIATQPFPSIPTTFDKPVAVYARNSAYELLSELHCGQVKWHLSQQSAHLALLEEDDSASLLNTFAETLLNEADTYIGDLSKNNQQSASKIESLLKEALGAAISQDLRASLFLHLALTLQLSHRKLRLCNLYDLFVAPEFPTWDWGSFLQQTTALGDVFRGHLLSYSASSMQDDFASYLEEALKETKSFSAREDQLKAAEPFSTRYVPSFNEDTLKKLLSEANNSGSLKADFEQADVVHSFAAIPATYVCSEALSSGLIRINYDSLLYYTKTLKSDLLMELTTEEKILVRMVDDL